MAHHVGFQARFGLVRLGQGENFCGVKTLSTEYTPGNTREVLHVLLPLWLNAKHLRQVLALLRDCGHAGLVLVVGRQSRAASCLHHQARLGQVCWQHHYIANVVLWPRPELDNKCKYSIYSKFAYK